MTTRTIKVYIIKKNGGVMEVTMVSKDKWLTT